MKILVHSGISSNECDNCLSTSTFQTALRMSEQWQCPCGKELCLRYAAWGSVLAGEECARADLLFRLSSADTWLSFAYDVCRAPGLELFISDFEALMASLQGLLAYNLRHLHLTMGVKQKEVVVEMATRAARSPCGRRLPSTVLEILPDSLREYKCVTLAAVQTQGLLLQVVKGSLAEDADVVAAAVAQDASAVQHVSAAAWAKPEVCLRVSAALPSRRRNEVSLRLPMATRATDLPPDSEYVAVSAASLICPVCLEDLAQSALGVRQCLRGHLLCGECLDGLPALGDEVACPTCRAQAPRQAFVANLWVEQLLENRYALCPHAGCRAALQGRKRLIEHLNKVPANARDICRQQPVPCPCCHARIPMDTLRHHLVKEHAARAQWRLIVEERDCRYLNFPKPLVLFLSGGFVLKSVEYVLNLGNLTVCMEAVPLLGPDEIAVDFTAKAAARGRMYVEGARLFLTPGQAQMRTFHIGRPDLGSFIELSADLPEDQKSGQAVKRRREATEHQ